MKLPQTHTLKQIAEILNVDFKGEPDYKITGLNEIHKVVEGDITFVDIAKYYKKALTSAASVIIINDANVEPPAGKALLISDNPFTDYNRLVKYFTPVSSFYSNNFNDVKKIAVGENVIIHPGVVIGNNVTIGSNTVIFPNVVIYENTTIGKNCIIHSGTVIGAHAFYFKKRDDGFEKLESCGEVIIKDNVEIGASCTIDKGVSGKTIIGENTKLDNQVHVGHGVEIGKMCLIAAQTGIGGKTIIEDEVIIWGQAGITKDIRIGAKAVISAQAGVSKSLKGGKLYFGSPAREADKAYKELAALRRLVKD